MNEPRWLVIVMGPPTTAAIILEPTDEQQHAAIGLRMRRAGYARVTPHHWNTAAWPLSRTSAIDVVLGDLVRITTGQTSLYTGRESAPRFPLSPLWLTAARERRAMVGLIPPGTIVTGGGDGEVDEVARRADVEAAMHRRELLGASALVRFDLPVSRPA